VAFREVGFPGEFIFIRAELKKRVAKKNFSGCKNGKASFFQKIDILTKNY